jgi:hypothetical protein
MIFMKAISEVKIRMFSHENFLGRAIVFGFIAASCVDCGGRIILEV